MCNADIACPTPRPGKYTPCLEKLQYTTFTHVTSVGYVNVRILVWVVMSWSTISIQVSGQ